MHTGRDRPGEPDVSLPHAHLARLAALAVAACIALPASAAPPVRHADARRLLARSACGALRSMARAVPGHGPMLLPSYPTAGSGGSKLRALEHVAFVYDNAVAGIALGACGAPAQARRIADALLAAPAHDPTYRDGRLRNAYRAGPMPDGKVALPGYWDAKHGYWKQDAYQVSTSTGNAAWAALLFLGVYHDTHDARYLDAAVQQLHWIQTHAYAGNAPAAYQGGLFGYDGNQRPQRWKSTEHNLDVHAAAAWAARERHDPVLTREARVAGAFIDAMWDRAAHRFYIGTQDDGATISRTLSALDAQVWPLLAFRPPHAGWTTVWRWVDTHHRVGAGYGYRRDPHGVWTEGTAQAADAMQASGRRVPDALWDLLLAQRAGDGLLYATPQQRIGTDLAIGPDSTHADFFYYHLPHLGATAWAALAARGWNPFTGRPVGTKEDTR